MTITTDKNKTFDVNWAWAPVGDDDDMMIELAHDDRPLAEIAADFEGCERFHRTSEIEAPFETDYVGYTRIKRVIRNFRKGTVQITFEKSDEPR